MVRNKNHRCSEITSFKDFRREKEILTLHSKLIDTKLSLSFGQIRQSLTPSNLLSALAQKYLFPGVSKYFGDIL